MLLDAEANVPAKIHKVEATEIYGENLKWDQFPYFSMIWPNDLGPVQIWRRCPDEASVASARRLYLMIKEHQSATSGERRYRRGQADAANTAAEVALKSMTMAD